MVTLSILIIAIYFVFCLKVATIVEDRYGMHLSLFAFIVLVIIPFGLIFDFVL